MFKDNFMYTSKNYLCHYSVYIYIYIYIYIQSTQLENLINNVWTNICKWKDIPNKYKNNFITQNNKLPNFYNLIKTHKTDTTLQIRPIISSLERPLYEISWLLAQVLKPLLPTFLGHVKDSDEVIHRLIQLNTEQLMQNNYAFSWM